MKESADLQMCDRRCTPVFVLGRHRSGTTWLSNLIASNPAIYTPQHIRHYGQHESGFFTSLVPYCNWGRTEVDRRAIQAIFERADIWHLLFPYKPPVLDIEELGVEGYFNMAMSIAAERRDAIYWLEKTPAHTLRLAYLKHMYPNAIFIAVKRDTLGTVCSNVYKFGDPGKLSHWWRATVVTSVYHKLLYYHRDSLYTVQYDALVRETNSIVSGILNHIGVSVEWGAQARWSKNSSHVNEPPEITLSIRLIVLATAGILNLAPGVVHEKFVRKWLISRTNMKTLPKWLFRVFHGTDGKRNVPNE